MHICSKRTICSCKWLTADAKRRGAQRNNTISRANPHLTLLCKAEPFSAVRLSLMYKAALLAPHFEMIWFVKIPLRSLL